MQQSDMSGIQAFAHSRLVWRVGSSIVLLAVVIVSTNFLLTVYGLYHRLDSAAYAVFSTRHGWLWTHLAGGVLTIILGPVQFLTMWPQASPRLHRWTGQIYMGSMLVASAGAAGLIATSPAPFAIRVAFAATALAWLTTALTGMIMIRGGRVRSHRRWMLRSYLVTLSPIAFRAIIHFPGVMALAPPPVMIPILLWLVWILPLLICGGIYYIVDRTGLRPSNSFRPNPLRGSA